LILTASTTIFDDIYMHSLLMMRRYDDSEDDVTMNDEYVLLINRWNQAINANKWNITNQ
jgi:hypothetical protein